MPISIVNLELADPFNKKKRYKHKVKDIVLKKNNRLVVRTQVRPSRLEVMTEGDFD